MASAVTVLNDAERGSAPRRSARRGRERGTSMVEFALALPVFLIVIFAIVEFSIILTDQVQLTNASRDAARAGAIHFETTPVPIPDADRVTQAKTAATSSASSLISCPLATPTVTPYTTNTYNPAIITVSLQCTYSAITPIGALYTYLGKTLNLPTTLKSSVTRYVEP